MYRDAADEDYLIARFSARANLLYQFWWNAQQSIEKYLKAALLLNGVEVSSFGHKLVEMFQIARSFSGDLLPLLHCPPRPVISSRWPSTNPRGFTLVDDFIERIEQHGDPDNRYRVNSTYTFASDLVKYDEICFAIRRICFPLDIKLEEESITAQEWLQRNRTQHLHPRLAFEGSMSKNHEATWRDHFEWCNFAYFYEKTIDRGEYPRFGGSINAEPYLAIQSKNEDYLEALRWLAENGFPKRLRAEVISATKSSFVD